MQVNREKYRHCQKSTRDKTWDISEAHERGHWESIIFKHSSVYCVIEKSSSKPYIIVHALLPSHSSCYTEIAYVKGKRNTAKIYSA